MGKHYCLIFALKLWVFVRTTSGNSSFKQNKKKKKTFFLPTEILNFTSYENRKFFIYCIYRHFDIMSINFKNCGAFLLRCL